MNRKRLAAALAYVDEKAKRLTSLDQPKESDAVDMALEMGGSFIPGVSQALAARDFERARRADDEAGMAMAAASALPLGKLVGALKQYDPTMQKIFIGKSAKTWDAAAAKRAEELEAGGVAPEEIWRETGTFRAPDGQLRQEISDESAYLRQEPDFDAAIQAKKAEIAAINQRVRDLKKGVKTQPDLFPREFNRGVRELAATKKPLQEDIKGNFGLEYGKKGYLGSRARLAVEHPALFEAYPELGQKLVVRRNQPLGDSTRGQYSPTDNRVDIGSTLSNNPSAASSTALHELQHAIQETEGFARGGSATQFQPTALGAKAAEIKTELSKALTGGTSSSTREIIDNFDYLPADTATQIAKKFGFNDPNDLRNFIILESNKTTPFEQYRRLAGEAEARAVQGRKVLDREQRRRVFPLQSYDVPINELIIRR
jgi:hypothetical protein